MGRTRGSLDAPALFFDFVTASSVQIAPRRYRLCDFVIESAWPLPELIETPEEIGADVVLRRGETPRELPQTRQAGVCFAAQPGAFLCWLDGVARFHVVEGREIVVESFPGIAEDTLRSLLFSSPLAALLLQRGLVPLHASAVATSRGALVFAGSAGAGKSTLAAEFLRRGFGVLADDVAALRVSERCAAEVLPVSECVRLWPATADADGVAGDKRALASGGGSRGDALPLAGIVCLERGGRAPGQALRRLGGKEALAASLDAVYRPAFARGLGVDGAVFRQLAAVATAVPVFRLTAAEPMNPREVVTAVLEEFGR